MILDLPTSLEVNGKDMKINTDFRDIILIFIALNDEELNEREKLLVALNNLYVDDIDLEDLEEATDKAMWFFDWGKEYKAEKSMPKLLDWEKDYNSIMSAVSQKAKTVEDVRELPYMHWWTFLGYFAERGKCHLSTIMELREKIAKGEKLEKWEQELYLDNLDEIQLDDERDTELEEELGW